MDMSENEGEGADPRKEGLERVRANRVRIRSEGGPIGSIAIVEQALKDAAKLKPLETMVVDTSLIEKGFTPRDFIPASKANDDQSGQ